MLTNARLVNGLRVRVTERLFVLLIAIIEAGWQAPKRGCDIMLGDDTV